MNFAPAQIVCAFSICTICFSTKVNGITFAREEARNKELIKEREAEQRKSKAKGSVISPIKFQRKCETYVPVNYGRQPICSGLIYV